MNDTYYTIFTALVVLLLIASCVVVWYSGVKGVIWPFMKKKGTPRTFNKDVFIDDINSIIVAILIICIVAIVCIIIFIGPVYYGYFISVTVTDNTETFIEHLTYSTSNTPTFFIHWVIGAFLMTLTLFALSLIGLVILFPFWLYNRYFKKED